MPREVITIHVGQCGNQIGSEFWRLLMKEHGIGPRGSLGPDGLSESASTFFEPVDETGKSLGYPPIRKASGVKARALLIDMEEGVLGALSRSDIGSVLSERVSGQGGSGNNWAQGYAEHGSSRLSELTDRLRVLTERCDALQAVSFFHSLGGGTGSGLGTRFLESLVDELGEVMRMDTPVIPAPTNDDVVTSPYNTILALSHILPAADVVIPFDNAQLEKIVAKSGEVEKKKEKVFGSVNNHCASVVADLTASMRFGGSLNVDINELPLNLVPFPSLNILSSALVPGPSNPQPRTFSEGLRLAFSPYQQAVTPPSTEAWMKQIRLASSVFVRSETLSPSSLSSELTSMSGSLSLPVWNPDGFKIGLCSRPPVGSTLSILSLTNSTASREVLSRLLGSFDTLYKRKLYLHHYLNYIDEAFVEDAGERVRSLVNAYSFAEVQGGFLVHSDIDVDPLIE